MPQSLQMRPGSGGEPSFLAAFKGITVSLMLCEGGVVKAVEEFKKLPGWGESLFSRAYCTNTKTSCLSLHLKKHKKLGMVAHACNPSTGEAETGGSLGIAVQPTDSTLQTSGQ